MTPPRTVPVNLRVSPAFKAWLRREKKRRNLTARELADLLATAYVLALSSSRSRKGGKVTPWPTP